MKIKITSTLLISFFMGSLFAQGYPPNMFYERYDNYRQSGFDYRRFAHADILPLIDELRDNQMFEVSSIGVSLEGREIFLIKIGSGPVNVLAWSQMHGDESTATMALFDLFNFFAADDDLNPLRQSILENTTLYFIPMLNPDGAEKFRRRNALSIDLNRDALRLQFPESKALKSVRDSINPKFGFNLHDQNPRYSAGKSPHTATISFLAPAFNAEKEINDVRANTMKLIVKMSEALSRFIPGHIGRYDDEFEPRAFGDNFVKWGTSSVLIESGGWRNDTEKQFIRKLNFIALLTGFQSIASGSYAEENTEDYFLIPENDNILFDLLLKNLTIKFNGNDYIIDLGIDRDQSGDGSRNRFFGSIEDIGDLSVFYGLSELDCSGMELVKGKIYPDLLPDFEALEDLNISELLSEGYIAVRIEEYDNKERFTDLPINIIVGEREFNTDIGIGRPANFIILNNGKPRFAVINGFIYDLKINRNLILNGLILN